MKKKKNILQVKLDIGKNRLYFTIGGKVSKKALSELYTDVRFCVADLQPSFDVIADFSCCDFSQLSALSTFRKISSFLIANNVGTVVRVMNKNSVVYRQALNIASKIQGYKAPIVYSLEEAEELLSTSAQRNGTRLFLHNLKVDYTIDDQTLSAVIDNISISGCAMHSATKSPVRDQEITIKFILNQSKDSTQTFKVKAQVVRSNKTDFAVTYIDLEKDIKESLWASLLYESQKDL